MGLDSRDHREGHAPQGSGTALAGKAPSVIPVPPLAVIRTASGQGPQTEGMS